MRTTKGKVLLLLTVCFLLFSGTAYAKPALDKIISAKALDSHACDDTEWHFVITQIDDPANAPGSINVNWANGANASVPLDKVTGKTAHYATTANLDSTVTSATASIYDAWGGQFNLSHGPCGPPPVCVPPFDFVEGTWSGWYPHPTDPDKECHSRWNTWVDQNDPSIVCDTTFEEVCRDIPPDVCLDTNPVPGPWGPWYPHPTDPTKECHDRDVDYVDVNNPDRICRTETETACRDIPQPDEATYSISPLCAPNGGLGSLSVQIAGGLTFTVVGEGSLTQSGIIPNLAPGTYSYTAEADPGYKLIGNPNGTFEIKDCPPGKKPPKPKTGGGGLELLIGSGGLILAGGGLAVSRYFRRKRSA